MVRIITLMSILLTGICGGAETSGELKAKLDKNREAVYAAKGVIEAHEAYIEATNDPKLEKRRAEINALLDEMLKHKGEQHMQMQLKLKAGHKVYEFADACNVGENELARSLKSDIDLYLFRRKSLPDADILADNLPLIQKADAICKAPTKKVNDEKATEPEKKDEPKAEEKKGSKIKIYTLKDGTKIRAKSAMKVNGMYTFIKEDDSKVQAFEDDVEKIEEE